VKLFVSVEVDMKSQIIVIAVLSVLLLVAIGFIGTQYYLSKQAEKQNLVLQQGYQVGYQQAVGQLLQQAATCQPVPVTLENVTLNLIAVECLQGASQQQESEANIG